MSLELEFPTPMMTEELQTIWHLGSKEVIIFSGKLRNVTAYIANYTKAALEYKLNPTQKLRYFHNLLNEKAKSFYRHCVQAIYNKVDEAYVSIPNEFSIISRKDKTRIYLRYLLLKSVRDKTFLRCFRSFRGTS